MGSYTPTSTQQRPFHVLIAGGGIVGLTVAQGCREAGIPYTVLERDTDETRRHGWALTLHWCLTALERTIGPERAALLPGAVVDTSLRVDEGNFLFLNAQTCEIKYRIPPSKRRLRLHRQKLRDVLASGLDMTEGKALTGVELIPESEGGGVRALLSDGSSVEGSVLVGADGNNSQVRRFLLPPPLHHHELTRLPVHLVGVVRRLTPEQAAPVRALDPLLFQALHPESGNYLWYSVQECIVPESSPDEPASFDCLVIISWIAKDATSDEYAIPRKPRDQISLMKRRAAGFAEPLRSLVMDIPDDMEHTTPLRLGDFPPTEAWDNHGGRVTLAGDAAHAMTMYRGEGANHGILDAALLVDELKLVAKGEKGLAEAVADYEAEMRPRAHEAVLKSREAALVAHEWDRITDDSPIVGARTAPATAFK